MNNFSKILMGFAAVAMVGCSNDEPAQGGVNPDGPKGDVAYMTIRLRDVNEGSRAVTLPGTENGSEAEHTVNNALFLFFDKNGAYVGKATPWTAGADNGNHGSTGNNVEFKSGTVVVLEDLTGKDYPSYMLTVLNASGFTAEPTLPATAKKLQGWGTKDNFVMTTSSYYGQDDTRHDDKYYYATKVTAADFRDQVGSTPVNPESVVEIYVERLAAKVELKVADGIEKGTGANANRYKINATIAGNPNADESMGTTDIYVEFNGWALSNTTNTSYVSKNIDGWADKAAEGKTVPFAGWNDTDNFRSYWAKSIIYDGFDVSKVTRLGYDKLKNTVGSSVEYCNENTMPSYDVPSQATTVLVAATAYDKDGNALDLVRFNGLLFKNQDYFAHILNAANAAGKLNYWYKTGTESIPVLDNNGELTYDEKGNVATTTTNTYAQFGTAQITLALKGIEDALVDKAVAKVENVTLPEGAELFTKNAAGKFEAASFTADDVKNALTEFVNTNYSTPVEAFNGGRMYYTIPVEHNMAVGTNIVEGYYGVVRNHWYRLNINKIARIGHGVFTPGDGSDENPGKPIVPQDPEEFFYLGATVNILSWKIVEQGVEL